MSSILSTKLKKIDAMFEIIVSSYKGGKDNKESSFGCLDSIGDLQSVEFEEIEAILSVL